VKEVIAGWYDDGDEEARRWVQEVAPEPRRTARDAARRRQPAASRPRASDVRVLEFVRRRYAEERRLVTCYEVSAATGMPPLKSHSVLRRLVGNGAIIDMGKGAGFLPAYEAT